MNKTEYHYSSVKEYGLPDDIKLDPADSIASIIDKVAEPMLQAMKEKGDIVIRCNRMGDVGMVYNYTSIDDDTLLCDFTAQFSMETIIDEVINVMPENYGDEAPEVLTRIIESLESSVQKLKLARDALK